MMVIIMIIFIVLIIIIVDCIRHLKTSHTNNGSRWICENCTSYASSIADGSASNIPPEFFKTAISLGIN